MAKRKNPDLNAVHRDPTAIDAAILYLYYLQARRNGVVRK